MKKSKLIMKIFVIVLIAVSISCIHAQDASQRILPKGILPAAKKTIATSPLAAMPQQVQYAINHPFENLASALSFLDPQAAAVFKKYAGFDIPLNKPVFVRLLRQALQTGNLSKLNIIAILIASLQIPPSGELKKVAMFLVNRFVCKIAESGLLPGIESQLPFIVRTLKENNTVSNGLGKTIINGAGSIPFIGGFLKHAGKDIYGSLPGIAEAIRIYGDDPVRAINALTTTVSSSNISENTCAGLQRPPPPITGPAPQPPVVNPGGPIQPVHPIPLGPGPVILPA